MNRCEIRSFVSEEEADMGTLREQLEKVGYNASAAVRRVAVGMFSHRQRAAIERHHERQKVERLNATLDLLLDDAIFHGLSMGATTELLQQRVDQEEGYKPAIGEDWPEDF
jgi:hypothetical protein